MKKMLLVLLTFTFLSHSLPPKTEKSLDLTKAVSEGKVRYNIQGNSESTHYYQPVSLTLENTSSEAMVIRVPNGLKLQSSLSETQDLLLVKEELIALKPQETKSLLLFAMCTQQQNSAPSQEDTFSIGGMAEGPLAAIAKEVGKKEAFNTIGQYAIWSTTDAYALSNISGYDEALASHFRTFTANELGVEIPEIESIENYNNPITPERRLTGHVIGGEFNYKFTKTSDVTIGMFNERNVIVRELLNNPETKPGKHNFSFQFDTMQYTEDTYYIRLIINGRVKVNYKMRRDS